MFTADTADCSTEKSVGDGINHKYFSLNFIPALLRGRIILFTLLAAHMKRAPGAS